MASSMAEPEQVQQFELSNNSAQATAVQILLAVDARELQQQLRAYLAPCYQVHLLTSLDFLIDTLSDRKPAILIVDEMMVDDSGRSALQLVRSDWRFTSVPIIQIIDSEPTAMEDEIAADEYLRLPVIKRELLARVRSATRILHCQYQLATRDRLPDELRNRVLENVSDDFISVDSSWCITHVNTATTQTFALTREELVGENLWNILPGVVGTAFEFEYRRAMTERVRLTVDAPFEPLKGWFEVTVVPREDGGLDFYSHNKAHLKRSQADAKAKEQRLRFVMDAMPQMIFTAGASGEVDYMNPVWTEFTGLPLTQILGWGWTQFIHPDDVERNVERWKHSVKTGEAFYYQHRFRNAQGEYRWHLTRAVPFRDDKGRITMWIGSNTDIHEVKAVKNQLAERLAAEQRHGALLAYVAAASRTINAVLSVEHIIQTLTEEVRAILRVHQSVVVLKAGEDWGQAIEAIALSEKYARYRGNPPAPGMSSYYSKLCHSSKPLRLSHEGLECQETWQDITERFELRPPLPMRGCLSVPLIGRGGRQIGLIMVSDKIEGDFNEEDEAILSQLSMIAAVGIENARLYDSLREQDQRKDEFLATLAHELRNPLAPVRTGLEILRRADRGDEGSRVIGMMERQLAHLVRLVDDLMDISRVSRGLVELRQERVPLRTIVNAAVETSRPLIESFRHTLTTRIEDNTLYVDGDLTRLAQVLSNLLNNAARYTPEGGRIELSARRDGEAVVIEVKDTGVGIPREMLNEVFELFRQVGHSIERTQGGLGIGLSLVKKLVEMHKGSVVAHSDGPGLGATFTVRLPQARPAPEVEAPKEREVVAVAGQRILIVDDNIDAAEALCMLLSLSGHRVETAHSGPEALDVAERYQPEVVFLDIGLPGMNGYEVAARMRQSQTLSKTVLIALTGWGSEEDRRRSKEAGFDYHLIKPIDVATVSSVLERFFPVQTGK